jgi:hypothetical protein
MYSYFVVPEQLAGDEVEIVDTRLFEVPELSVEHVPPGQLLSSHDE